MKREITSLLVTFSVVLAAASACDDDAKTCTADADCPTGEVCRESRCAALGSDAGTPTSDAAPTTCSSDGLTCSSPDECCSRRCTDGKCGAPVTPPPACKQAYEACQTEECCSNLKCTSGICR